MCVYVQVAGLTLQLQHAIHAARRVPEPDAQAAALAKGAGSSLGGAPSSAAAQLSSPSGAAAPAAHVAATPDTHANAAPSTADDRSSSMPSRSSNLRRRGGTRFTSTPRGGPSGNGGGSTASGLPRLHTDQNAASLLSDAHVPGALLSGDGEAPGAMSPAWHAGYVLDCPLEADDDGAVSIRPGDNHLLFSACPLHEGLHLLDCAYGTLECPAQHSLLIEARFGSSAAAGGIVEDEPLGAALVARADEDNLAVHSVIPGGMLLESQSQWLGVRLAPARGEVRDVTMRVALRAVDRAAPLEFAHVAQSAEEAVAASTAAAGSGGGAAAGAAGVGPDVALWQRRGSGNAEVVRCVDGEVELAGPLAAGGTLWLPVHCRQQHQLVQLVDIGAGAMLTEDKGERAPVDTLDALAEVALSYWSGCWRSKHIRLQLPVQVCLLLRSITACSITACALSCRSRWVPGDVPDTP